jgi:hypothetical protein
MYNMKDWFSTIYKACIFASVISFFIGFFTQSNTSLGAFIAGYSVLILGILMILVMLFANVLRVTSGTSIWQTIVAIAMTAGPFILILAIIAFVLYMLINYKKKIIAGHVAPGFNSFSNIVVVLLLVQLYIVYGAINSERFDITGKLPRVTTLIVYLLSVLTGISTIVLYTILKYYSTDGFTSTRLL